MKFTNEFKTKKETTTCCAWVHGLRNAMIRIDGDVGAGTIELRTASTVAVWCVTSCLWIGSFLKAVLAIASGLVGD